MDEIRKDFPSGKTTFQRMRDGSTGKATKVDYLGKQESNLPGFSFQIQRGWSGDVTHTLKEVKDAGGKTVTTGKEYDPKTKRLVADTTGVWGEGTYTFVRRIFDDQGNAVETEQNEHSVYTRNNTEVPDLKLRNTKRFDPDGTCVYWQKKEFISDTEDHRLTERRTSIRLPTSGDKLCSVNEFFDESGRLKRYNVVVLPPYNTNTSLWDFEESIDYRGTNVAEIRSLVYKRSEGNREVIGSSTKQYDQTTGRLSQCAETVFSPVTGVVRWKRTVTPQYDNDSKITGIQYAVQVDKQSWTGNDTHDPQKDGYTDWQSDYLSPLSEPPSTLFDVPSWAKMPDWVTKPSWIRRHLTFDYKSGQPVMNELIIDAYPKDLQILDYPKIQKAPLLKVRIG